MYGAIWGAQSPGVPQNNNSLTNISLVVYMRPVADDGMVCESVESSDTARDLHHREIRVTLDPRFLDSQGGIPLKELSFSYQWSGHGVNRRITLTPRIKLLVS